MVMRVTDRELRFERRFLGYRESQSLPP
jgi:hypothetical protein